MAVAILTVRATIAPEQEAAFNHWYDREHGGMSRSMLKS